MEENSGKTYVVILNYNGWEDTVECLDSVLLSQHIPYRIVVVDNNSANLSVENILDWAKKSVETVLVVGPDPDNNELYVRSNVAGHGRISGLDQASATGNERHFAHPLVIIQTRKNGGFAYGNNIGINFALQQADCEYIWLLNNDTVILPNTLYELVSYFTRTRQKEKLGILGCIQRFYSDPTTVQAVAGAFDKWKARIWNVGAGSRFLGSNTEIPRCDYVYGASMMLSRECITEVGVLNEEYFMYFEEIDYAVRAKKKGYSWSVCRDASILHKYRASASREGEEFKEYYLRRNIIKFYKLYYPRLVIIPLTKLLLIILRNLFRGRRFEALYVRIIKESLHEYLN
jgi:GT2 family glycosyltransferase